MTTKSELIKLFNFDAKTTRIISFAGAAGVVTVNDSPHIGVMTAILDPKTKKKTDKTLTTFLSPLDALALARAILETARRRGWKEPPESEFVEYTISPDKKTN